MLLESIYFVRKQQKKMKKNMNRKHYKKVDKKIYIRRKNDDFLNEEVKIFKVIVDSV